MVRGVGPRLPVRRHRPRRRRVRQGPAAADVPRVVHAPQRPAAGLRVGVRRRQPAGARLGRAARVRDRRRRHRHARPRVPRAHLPQAAAQLHVVGQPQGRRRRQRLRGRLPRDGQHRPDRPLGSAAGRGPARAVRRDRLDGDVLPQHAGDRARCSPSAPRPTRTWRRSSSSTSPTSPRRSTTAACGTTRTASTTTCCAIGDERIPLRVRSMVGLLPAVRGDDARPGTLERLPDFAARLRWFVEQQAAVRRATSTTATSATATRAGCWRSSARTGSPHPRPAARRGRAPVAARRAARCRPATATSRSPSSSAGMRPRASTTSRASRTTGLFGGNSNWRGPVWFPVNALVVDALRAYGRFFGDDLTVEHPTGSGQPADAAPRSPTTSPTASSRSFREGPDGRRPVHGAVREVPRPTRRGTTRSRSTSTSTATPAPVSAPRTRPAGPGWSPTCC